MRSAQAGVYGNRTSDRGTAALLWSKQSEPFNRAAAVPRDGGRVGCIRLPGRRPVRWRLRPSRSARDVPRSSMRLRTEGMRCVPFRRRNEDSDFRFDDHLRAAIMHFKSHEIFHSTFWVIFLCHFCNIKYGGKIISPFRLPYFLQSSANYSKMRYFHVQATQFQTSP